MLPPTTHLIVNVISTSLTVVYNVYLFSSLMLINGRMWAALRRNLSLANLLWYWSKWPALSFVITNPPLTILLNGKLRPWEIVFDVLSGVVWWFSRNSGDDDDDDHKKLKKKLKEKIEAIGGKLVIVPEPA